MKKRTKQSDFPIGCKVRARKGVLLSVPEQGEGHGRDCEKKTKRQIEQFNALLDYNPALKGESIRITVSVANSQKEGDEKYQESCDQQMKEIEALLLPGWQARWMGFGNTDGDGECTEDMEIEFKE